MTATTILSSIGVKPSCDSMLDPVSVMEEAH